MPFRCLFVLLLLLHGHARRSIRIDDFHLDDQRQDSALASGLAVTVEARETLIPIRFGTRFRHHDGRHADYLRLRRAAPWLGLGPRRAKVALQAAAASEEDQLPLNASGGGSGPALLPVEVGDKFTITTAINYANGPPHMGHAYEAVLADVLARYHRIYGRQVFFLMGSDEHGQKIAETAAKQEPPMKPIELCDKHVADFKDLNKALSISEDFYVRTTSEKHIKLAQKIWRKCEEAGDIYLGSYTGWYNVREEIFVPDAEAKAADFKDPASGALLVKMDEESYFFRLSKFHERIVRHITDNPHFVQPRERRNEILARLAKDPLRDLSISRKTFDWGVPCPSDPKHVMYVWFDALVNYLSGMDYGDDSPTAQFWPAQGHVIGKDIIWFHCVIWPAILMSANISLPKAVIAHGFVTAADGQKMSKSLGNVVDPYDCLKKFPADSLRYFLVREAPFGGDLSFDDEKLAQRHNSELADKLGNLVNRVMNLARNAKYCGGVLPDVSNEGSPFDLAALRVECEAHMSNFKTMQYLETVWGACSDINKYLDDQQPWKVDKDLAVRIIKTTLEAIYALCHFVEPVMPAVAATIFHMLGQKPTTIAKLSPALDNLKPGEPLGALPLGMNKDAVLFVKYEKSELDGKAVLAKRSSGGGK